MAEYLVRIEVIRPVGVDDEGWQQIVDAERVVGLDYIRRGVIRRIWRIPGTTANVGVWSAEDASELDQNLRGLPAFAHMSIAVEALALHYLEIQSSLLTDDEG